MQERLQKILAQGGLGSRRQCEEFIQKGHIRIDGKIIRELGVKIDPAKSQIYYNGKLVKLEPKVYFILNKPKGYLCTNYNHAARPRVIDLFPKAYQRLYTVGRLDADSEGLLIVTNDGTLCNFLTHPRYEVPKTYQIAINGYLESKVIEKITRGVWLSEGKTSPVRIRIIKRTRSFTALEITLKEGKNREIRRIFARFGYKVKFLKRTKIGSLTLNLRTGQYQQVNRHKLLQLIGMHYLS